MLDWLKKNTLAAREKLTTEVGKFKNKEFMEAINKKQTVHNLDQFDLRSGEDTVVIVVQV